MTMTVEQCIQNGELLSLRVKRPHKKVRSGCVTCKGARVKCDEKRPCCTRCRRKTLECAYSESFSKISLLPALLAVDGRSKPIHVDSESSQSPECSNVSSANESRCPDVIQETMLAEHYLTHTVQSICYDRVYEEQVNVFRVFIPAVAVTCPVVRQGILTLGAMCLHYDSISAEPTRHSMEHLEVAETHGNIFVKESRQMLQDFQEGMNLQNPNAILACSRLLCVLGLAFFRTHRKTGATLADPEAWTWLQLMRGVKTSYTVFVGYGYSVDEIIKKDMTPNLYCTRLDSRTNFKCQHPALDYVLQTRRERIDALWDTFSRDGTSFGEQKTADLSAAIDLLYEVTEEISLPLVQSLFRTACRWPVNVPKGFVDMLLGGFAPALAVYAHWLMLTVLVEYLWWIDDMGRDGIRNVVAMCSDADQSVQRLLAWPQLMLEMTTGKAPKEHAH